MALSCEIPEFSSSPNIVYSIQVAVDYRIFTYLSFYMDIVSSAPTVTSLSGCQLNWNNDPFHLCGCGPDSLVTILGSFFLEQPEITVGGSSASDIIVSPSLVTIAHLPDDLAENVWYDMIISENGYNINLAKAISYSSSNFCSNPNPPSSNSNNSAGGIILIIVIVVVVITGLCAIAVIRYRRRASLSVVKSGLLTSERSAAVPSATIPVAQSLNQPYPSPSTNYYPATALYLPPLSKSSTPLSPSPTSHIQYQHAPAQYYANPSSINYAPPTVSLLSDPAAGGKSWYTKQ